MAKCRAPALTGMTQQNFTLRCWIHKQIEAKILSDINRMMLLRTDGTVFHSAQNSFPSVSVASRILVVHSQFLHGEKGRFIAVNLVYNIAIYCQTWLVINAPCIAYDVTKNIINYDDVISYLWIQSCHVTYQMKGFALPITMLLVSWRYFYWLKRYGHFAKFGNLPILVFQVYTSISRLLIMIDKKFFHEVEGQYIAQIWSRICLHRFWIIIEQNEAVKRLHIMTWFPVFRFRRPYLTSEVSAILHVVRYL